ncbi:unnamed protein product [Owenia fusiformis]|uniref:Nuclear transcription factor Y subunit gamma n=1 Tax=Owenia fusiformis TaxID=6347 RepID=A0A8J1UDG7_OWEFU|nr:unnamed protein product [Owenia fusiformis]
MAAEGNTFGQVVTVAHPDPPTEAESASPSEAQGLLANFWTKQNNDMRTLGVTDYKTQELPLARIKKIMKLDEDVKMISSEAPVIFAKAAEMFISELSLRAWVHTEDNKRRTLQRNDIAMAITKYDQFDFLIDIVPRDEIKQTKRPEDTQSAKTSMMPDQVQYYFQLAQQHQQALQQQNQQQQQQQQQQQTQVTAATTTTPTVNQVQLQGSEQQQIQVIQGTGTGEQPQIQIIQGGQQAGAAQVQQVPQVIQQIVTPSGEVQSVPIQLTPAQLQAIQLQMSGKQSGQSVVIQASNPAPESEQQGGQQQQIFQMGSQGQQIVFQQGTQENQSNSQTSEGQNTS